MGLLVSYLGAIRGIRGPTVDSKSWNMAVGNSCRVSLFLWFGVGGRPCSNFLASTSTVRQLPLQVLNFFTLSFASP